MEHIVTDQPKQPLGTFKTIGLILGAVIAFTMAYSGPHCWILMLAFVWCILTLARRGTTRSAFYGGWTMGLLAYSYQLWFFREIFGNAAVLLWLVASFWLMFFVVLARLCFASFKPVVALSLMPFLWTGLEYFRGELYYLKFSWLNIGYALPPVLNSFGMYFAGFIAVAAFALFYCWRELRLSFVQGVFIIVCLLVPLIFYLPALTEANRRHVVKIAGIQLEFETGKEVMAALHKLALKYPDAELLVLSEYTLDGPPPEEMKSWCRENNRFLIVGGQDPTPDGNYYNTAFVISTNGEVIFKQAKSVPIQFFKDGLPAPEQKVWNSPWGKIGVCICYDLSYTRVTDELVRQGAQALIVPTMDVADWGTHEHKLHALVAPVRATEYGIPIFRLASSGISQFVDYNGQVIATAPFPGEGAMIQSDLIIRNSGRLPLDRFLAPICVAVTAMVIVVLPVMGLRRKFVKPRQITV